MDAPRPSLAWPHTPRVSQTQAGTPRVCLGYTHATLLRGEDIVAGGGAVAARRTHRGRRRCAARYGGPRRRYPGPGIAGATGGPTGPPPWRRPQTTGPSTGYSTSGVVVGRGVTHWAGKSWDGGQEKGGVGETTHGAGVQKP